MSRASLLRWTGSALVALSVLAFLLVDKFSPTALIPAGFGALVVACGLGTPSRWRVVLGGALLGVVSAALAVPFRSALEDGDLWGMVRVGAMISVSVLGCVGLWTTGRSRI